MADWTTDFFAPIALDAWQRSRGRQQTLDEVAFLEHALGLCEGPRRLLDVPAGDGRHAVELAALGHRVTALDRASDNARRVAERAAAAGVEVDFVRGDMRDPLPPGPFDGAYCMGNSFGYFPRAQTRAFLGGLSAALAPGACFVLDTATAAESILVELAAHSWERVDDELLLLLECEYNAVESRLDTTYTSVLGDRVVDTRTSHHYVFTSGEIIAMLADAGLQTLAALADLEGSPFELGAERLLLIARKGEPDAATP